MSHSQDRYLTTGQVARWFGVNRKTVWLWITAGKLVPAHKTIGGHYRFAREYIQSLTSDGRKGPGPMICPSCAQGEHKQCKYIGCTCQHREPARELETVYVADVDMESEPGKGNSCD